MQLDLLPTISLASGSFSILIAPPDMMISAINSHPNIQCYRVLYVCGNYSHILTRLNRNVTELAVRRAFTAFQLMTILEEHHHSIVIVEHDLTLFEEAEGLQDYIAHALREAAERAIVLLYSPASDRFIDDISALADRVFCFAIAQEPEWQVRTHKKESLEGQTTLGAF